MGAMRNAFALTCLFAALLPAQNKPLCFSLGEAVTPGCQKVAPSDTYSKQRGYGYDSNAQLTLSTHVATSNKPFLFSVALPEGNYRVTVTLGGMEKESVTTVKAELRRLMLESVTTRPGEAVKRSFIVNIRTPQIPDGTEVRLKPREKTSEAVAWDERLTLEFNDAQPAVERIDIEPAGKIPTIYIAGDSTSTDQPGEPYNSWGQMITRFFAPTIAIANHGESGETIRSFIGERRLAKVLSVIQPGDFLLIQFGHNDMKEKGEGVGAFTTYKTDLKRMITEVRKKGVTPILITPMNRRTFGPDGKIYNSLGDYPEAVRQTAREEQTALIDLNALSKTLYDAIGEPDSPKAFAPNDGTHHNNYGSYELARCIVESIRSQKLPLASYLLPGLAVFDPAHPDSLATFHIAPSPVGNAEKPYGND